MKNTMFLILLAVFVVQPALADESYVCTAGEAERVISVVYSTPGEALPCDVRYKKDGATVVLWKSEFTEGFCEQKAEEFVQKQIGFGWNCNNVSLESSVDDTASN